MVTIKRESIKGKYFVVAREEPKRKGAKGKIITRRKWGKVFTISQAKQIFKSNNSFFRNLKVEKLKNVKEVVDYRPKFVKPRSGKYQYAFETIINNEKISARSMLHPSSYPVSLSKKEAEESFYERIAQKLGFDYEARLGVQAFERLRKPPIIKQGIIYYQKI